MKKIINIIIIATLCLSLIGCTKDKEEKAEKVNNKNTNDIIEKTPNASENQEKDEEGSNSNTNDTNTSVAGSTATEVPMDNPKTSDTTSQINKGEAINILKTKTKQQLHLSMALSDYNIDVTEDITIKNISCYRLKAYNQTTNELEGLFAISKDGEIIFRHNGQRYVKVN